MDEQTIPANILLSFTDAMGNPLRGVQIPTDENNNPVPVDEWQRGGTLRYKDGVYEIKEIFWYTSRKVNVQLGYDPSPVTTTEKPAKKKITKVQQKPKKKVAA